MSTLQTAIPLDYQKIIHAKPSTKVTKIHF
jgi:hypothetical protein